MTLTSFLTVENNMSVYVRLVIVDLGFGQDLL